MAYFIDPALRIMPGDSRWRLTVTGVIRGTSSKLRVVCDCGSPEKMIARGDWGRVKSCGCLTREVARERARERNKERATHGMKGTPTHNSWMGMIQRCHNPSNPAYSYYGARGITVCPRWRESFEAFLSDVGEKPSPDLSIDRIDVNGNYEPGNVRWATKAQQSQNRRPRTHCFQGHELTPVNTYVKPSTGERQCRTCRKANRDKRP